MNYRLLDPYPPPSIEDSARHLAEWNALSWRERRKARARQMNADMGREIPEALR
jgi:hypothetical protein